MSPKLRYPSSLISLPLSLIFSNLPTSFVVVLGVMAVVEVGDAGVGAPVDSTDFKISVSQVLTEAFCPLAVLVFDSTEFCFFLNSPNRRGLGEIERLPNCVDVKLLSSG